MLLVAVVREPVQQDPHVFQDGLRPVRIRVGGENGRRRLPAAAPPAAGHEGVEKDGRR